MPPTPYPYIGPDEIREATRGVPAGTPIRTRADLEQWLAAQQAGAELIATYVVGLDGLLHVASRHSEHVACAGGRPVLAAGEITFTRRDVADGPRVVAVSNQSTGYCPEPSCWPAVAAALDGAGIAHPGGFTATCLFRRCPACGQCNLVKDGWFFCDACDAELPEVWNFGR